MFTKICLNTNNICKDLMKFNHNKQFKTKLAQLFSVKYLQK